MIGKGTAISSTKAAIAYGNDHDKGAEQVYSNLLTGDSPEDIAKEFKAIQSLNVNCERNTFSFVLSPTIEDGKKLDNQALGNICAKFMDEMKLADRQAVAYVHLDKAHKHIHLYVNRIDLKGTAYKDSFIGKRCQQAAERIAKDLGLQTVKEVNEKRLSQLLGVRVEIKTIHHKVLSKNPLTIDAYIKNMKAQGVQVKPCINKANKLQGFRFQYKGYDLKASEVHRSLSGARLIQSINAQTYKTVLNKKNNSIFIQGIRLALSGNIVNGLAKILLKKAIRKGIDKGMEL